MQSPLHLQLALRAVASILPMNHIIGKHIGKQQQVCQSHQAYQGQHQEIYFLWGMALQSRAVVNFKFEGKGVHID